MTNVSGSGLMQVSLPTLALASSCTCLSLPPGQSQNYTGTSSRPLGSWYLSHQWYLLAFFPHAIQRDAEVPNVPIGWVWLPSSRGVLDFSRVLGFSIPLGLSVGDPANEDSWMFLLFLVYQGKMYEAECGFRRPRKTVDGYIFGDGALLVSCVFGRLNLPCRMYNWYPVC